MAPKRLENVTPEGRIKAKVSAELKKLGYQCWRFMPVQTGFGTPALDYLACINGWFVSIETKKDAKSKLTDRQEATKLDMEKAGGIVLVVYDEASLERAMKVINIITRVNGNEHVRDLVAPIANDPPAQAQGASEQHVREQQQAQAPDRAAGRDHGAPRKKPQRRPKPAARGDDPAVTAAVTYFCVCCGLPAHHPSVLRSIPYCCGYPMKRNPMTNGS